MAQVTGTHSTYDAVGNREELDNIIYQIDREETPFLSMIGSSKITSVNPEWLIDELATPATNAQIEGDDFTYASVTAPTRVKNYAQIFRKDLIISETQEAVDQAGNATKVSRQVSKKGVELRRDIEYAMLSNQASVAGNDSTPRKLGGFPAWLTTNVERNSGGSDGGFNSGTGVVDANTPGTLRAFTKALFDTVIQQTWESGGRPKFAMVSPYNKRVFSTFMSDSNVASFRYAASGSSNSIIATADVYESDFGKLSVVPNHIMGAVSGASVARYVHVVDPSKVERGVLRATKVVTPAVTGDAVKKVLITELTLKVLNEAAHGEVADVFGLTAST